MGGLLKAHELFVPDRRDQLELGADVDIPVVRPIGFANVAIGLENLTPKDRVRPFEYGKSIWNENHVFVLTLWWMNPIRA